MRSVGPAKRTPTSAIERWWLIPLLGIALIGAVSEATAHTFNSGSDGSDGTFVAGGPPGTVVIFDPSQFHGSQVSANIFHFVTITIAAGVTVRLSGDVINGPVYWLSQGDVVIEGTVDLNGGNGYDITSSPFLRVPSTPGAGGYRGGVGGNPTQRPLPGGSPKGDCRELRSRMSRWRRSLSRQLLPYPADWWSWRRRWRQAARRALSASRRRWRWSPADRQFNSHLGQRHDYSQWGFHGSLLHQLLRPLRPARRRQRWCRSVGL